MSSNGLTRAAKAVGLVLGAITICASLWVVASWAADVNRDRQDWKAIHAKLTEIVDRLVKIQGREEMEREIEGRYRRKYERERAREADR